MGSLPVGRLLVRRYGLSDDQFARVEDLLPGRPGPIGRDSALGNRRFVEAVIWKFRSGAPWRDLPERFGASRDQAIGRSRGGPTTKIHVIVDALGNPLALRLTGALSL